METLWILLFIVVVFLYLDKAFGIVNIIKKKLNPPPPPPPPPPEPEYPYCKKNLLTKIEIEFFKKLKPVTDEYSLGINFKTCLDDIISIKNTENNLDELFNKIKFKSIDFVIIDPDSMSAECLIEIRDGSHKEPQQIEEDKFLKTLCEKNNIDFIIYQGDFESITKYFNENWEKQT